MLFRVRWRDGSATENISNEEAMRLIAERPLDWAGVHSMDYAKDCDPKNEIAKKKAWGAKKKKSK